MEVSALQAGGDVVREHAIGCSGRSSRDDIRFVADLARRMQWGTRFGADDEADDLAREVHGQIASGTLDALLWLLEVTDVAPIRGLPRPRTASSVERELAVGRAMLLEVPEGSRDWYYLAGVADGLEFALGLRGDFWWVPLPADLRRGPPTRDEHAFRV